MSGSLEEPKWHLASFKLFLYHVLAADLTHITSPGAAYNHTKYTRVSVQPFVSILRYTVNLSLQSLLLHGLHEGILRLQLILLLCLPLFVVEADDRAVAFTTRVVRLRGLSVADRSTLLMLDVAIFVRELLGQALGALFQFNVHGHIIDEEALSIAFLIFQTILRQAAFLEA